MKLESPHHLHASTRCQWPGCGVVSVWGTAATIQGTSGKFYALVEGNVDDVAAVLKVPYFLRPEGPYLKASRLT